MRAARFQEFAVHVGDAARAGALMQIVDVLGDERQLVAVLGESRVQPGEREMGGVGLRIEDVPAAEIVEGVNLLRVFGEGFGVASFIGSNRDQRPPLSRKVPSPLSAEMPAPVRTRIFMTDSRVARSGTPTRAILPSP
jgi:hypothetical protein